MIKKVGIACALLGALTALTACGSEIPGSRSSPVGFTGPVQPPTPTVTVSVAGRTVTAPPPAGQQAPSPGAPSPAGTARAGTYCGKEGVTGRTANGRQVRCVKPNGQTGTRWIIDTGANSDGSVKPGSPCPAAGAVGQNGGKKFVCAKTGTGTYRWRAA